MDFRRLIDAGVSLEEIAGIDAAEQERVQAGQRVQRKRARIAEPTPLPDPEPQQAAAVEAEKPTVGRWTIRKAWVAISPTGTLHGPFDEHAAAVVFIGGPEGQKRPPTRPMTPELLKRAIELWRTGLSDLKISRRLSVSQGSLSRRLRQAGYAANGKRFGS